MLSIFVANEQDRVAALEEEARELVTLRKQNNENAKKVDEL